MPETEHTFHDRLDRIEVLIHQIQAAQDPAVQSSAEELVELLLELHRTGLERVLEIVWEAGDVGQRIIHEELPEEELVSSLLILHGLHPLSLEARVMQALEKVRPYMNSHGGGVELLGIENGVVRLSLQGSCGSCRASAITLKYAVEDAIYEAAPEILEVEAVGLTDDRAESSDGLIPLEILGNGDEAATGRATSARGEWYEVERLSALDKRAILTKRIDGRSVLFCRIGDALYAYGNVCPRCHQPLEGARMEQATLRCPHCEQTYDVIKAGRAADGSNHQLEPIPLLEENGRVRIALTEAF